MEIIAIELSKKIKDKNILNSVYLHVKKGKIYGLIGPNGAGKTSLIRTLLGIYKPTSGSVTINGVSPVDKEFIKLKYKIGVVMDHLGLYKDLTVWENLEFFHRIYFPNAKKNIRKEDIELALKITNMHHKRYENIVFLSRGQKQRLAISRALVIKPKLLVLDEPTTGLDVEGRILLRELLKNINDMGITILLSSHNLNELQKICSTFAFINRGKIVEESNFNELKIKYKLFGKEFSLEDIYREIFKLDYKKDRE